MPFVFCFFCFFLIILFYDKKLKDTAVSQPHGVNTQTTYTRDRYFYSSYIIIIQPFNPYQIHKGLVSFTGFADARVPPCELIYYSAADKTFQNGDPRGGGQNANDVLPDGWTEDTDIDGDSYWVDWNSDTLTYDDPRLVLKPKKSEVLAATVGATKAKEHDQPAAKPRTLKRRSSVRAALQLPTDSEYATWKIGAKETMAFSLLNMNVVDRAELPGEVINKKMNRHLDILPNPRTRVILPVPFGKGTFATLTPPHPDCICFVVFDKLGDPQSGATLPCVWVVEGAAAWVCPNQGLTIPPASAGCHVPIRRRQNKAGVTPPHHLSYPLGVGSTTAHVMLTCAILPV